MLATAPEILFDGPPGAPVTLALAHGAGAPMESPFMTAFAAGLAGRSHGRWRIARFEFPFMAARRAGGRKRPPDTQAKLLDAWRAVIAALGAKRLAVGGKSLGGRMASMVADEAGVRGLVCLGYPFHPPGKPERLRVAHLTALNTPTLIVQGTRDPLGRFEEIAGYALSPCIRLHWVAGAGHDLIPPKSSGQSAEQAWGDAMDAIADFLTRLEGAEG